MARLHHLRRWAARGMIALVAVLVIAVAVVSTPWFKGWLRGFVVSRVGGSINGELDVRRLSGSLFHDFVLDDVTIVQDGQPTLRIGRVRAQYDLLQLLAGRFVIDEIVLERPRIRIAQSRDGWNLAHLLKTREGGSPTSPRAIAIRQLRIADGEATIVRLDRPDHILQAINFEGGLSYASPDLIIDATRLQATDLRTGVPVEIAGRLTTSATHVRVERLALATPASRVSGDFVYDTAGGGSRMDANVTIGRLTLAEIATYLPPSLPPALIVTSGTAQASGRLERLHVIWALDSTAGRSRGDVTAGVTGETWPVEATLDVEHLDAAALAGRSDLDHDLTATVTARGMFARAAPLQSQLEFTLKADRIAALGYRVQALNSHGTLERAVLRVAGDLRAYGAAVHAAATVHGLGQPHGLRVVADGAVRHLNLSALPRSLGAPVVASDLSGRVQATVAENVWSARLTTDASRLAGATIRPGALVVAESRGARLTARVVASVADVPADVLRIPATRPTAFSGAIDADVTIHDTRRPFDLASVDGHVVADLSGSTVDGAALDTAIVDASLSAGVAHVRRLELRAHDLDVTASGVVAVTGGSENDSDLTFVVDAPDLQALASWGVTTLRGGAHVEGKVTGPFGDEAVVGAFHANRVGYASVADALTVNGTFDAHVPGHDLSQTAVALTTDATFVTIKGQDIQRLALTSSYRDQQIDLKSTIEQRARKIDLEGGLVFGPESRELRLRQLTIAGPGSPWHLATADGAVVRYGGDVVSLERLAFIRDAERLDASGRLDLSPAGKTDLGLRFSRVQLGDMYTMVFGAPRLTGTADGDVHLTGALSRPSATVTLTVVDGVVANVPFSSIRAAVDLRDRRARVDARVEEASGAALLVKGTVPVASDAGPIALEIDSERISLGLAEAFTAHVDNVKGEAAIHASVAGTLAAPSVTGRLTIADASLRVVPTGVVYVDLDAAVAFDGGRVAIDRVSLTDDDGHTLTMSGGAEVLTSGGAPRTFDVRLQSDGIHVLDNELGTIEISADAHAEGDLGAPRITGRLEVERGLLEIDEILPRLAPGSAASSTPEEPLPATPVGGNPAASPGAPPPTAPAPPPVERSTPAPSTGLFSRATIDLSLVLPDNVVVRGRNVRTATNSLGLGSVNLTLGGEVNIRKHAGETPVLVGSVEAIRGFYEFQGRRFEVVRGSTVAFRGTQPINPYLDVTGEREVSGVTVGVRATGTARQPRIDLSSRPPLDQADILSLIVFNEPVNELGQSQQVDLLRRASDMALSAVATPLGDSLARALDVDLFEIRTPTAGEAGELSIGRQVNERLFVGFRQQFGASDASRLSFEYAISQALRVLTSVAQGADRAKGTRDRETAGIDLVYVVRY